MDTSEPSTNGVSACNLYRLSSLLEDSSYAEKAEQTISAFESEILQYPNLFTTFMPGVVAGRLGIRATVIVEPEGVAHGAAQNSVKRPSARGGLNTIVKLSSDANWLRNRNHLLKDITAPKGGKPRVMICENGTCKEDDALAGAGTASSLPGTVTINSTTGKESPTVAPALVATASRAVHVAEASGIEADVGTQKISESKS